MEDNEWEAISGSSTTHSDEDDVVLVPSVFPPSDHEDLPVTTPPPPSSSSSSGVDETDIVPHEQEETGTDGKILSRLGDFRSGVFRVLYGIHGKVGVWSFAAVVSVLVVGVFGIRWQRWKTRIRNQANDRMMLLINQKDEVAVNFVVTALFCLQKIKQLLIQIDQLNEILSARRRVPVHRIVVDRALVTKQRLNWKPT
ncbi:hypothetical protein Tco_1176049 [Tanacetum coccineum]